MCFLRTENSKVTGSGNYRRRVETVNRGEYCVAGICILCRSQRALRSLPKLNGVRAGLSTETAATRS